MRTLDFRVDHVTRRHLDEPSLADIGAHLWPESCDTCSRSLGCRSAALWVTACASAGMATISHSSCRRPGWEDVAALPVEQGCDYRARALLLACRRGGEVRARPVLLVNPSLGRVPLANGSGRWRVATVENAARFGLHPGPDVVIVDRAGVRRTDEAGGRLAAVVRDGRVGVRLDDGREWWAPLDGAVLRQVRQLRGVLLAVTSAVRPDRVATVADVMPAVVEGRVALGWVGLADR